MKHPDKAWWKQTSQFYLYFGCLGGLISLGLMAIKTATQGFETYYIELVLRMTFIFPLLVTSVFCIPELLFGKSND